MSTWREGNPKLRILLTPLGSPTAGACTALVQMTLRRPFNESDGFAIRDQTNLDAQLGFSPQQLRLVEI